MPSSDLPIQFKTILADGDIILYRCCAALQMEVEMWNTGEFYSVVPLEEVKSVVIGQIDDILDKFDAEQLVLALSDKSTPNWRLDVLPSYKANRKASRPPVGFGVLRKWASEELGAMVLPRCEGDDVMGILQTQPDFQDKHGPSLIYSVDKDLKSIPGWYVPNRGCEPMYTTEASADRFHMEQTLVGDVVDGYKGCPKIGLKTAQRILDQGEEDGGDYWRPIVHAYIKAGLTEDDALTQARVARILRDTDWDEKNNLPILWEPKERAAPELPLFESAGIK